MQKILEKIKVRNYVVGYRSSYDIEPKLTRRSIKDTSYRASIGKCVSALRGNKGFQLPALEAFYSVERIQH